MNPCFCPACKSQAVVVDREDETRWVDEDDGLNLEIPFRCSDCGAVLTLHVKAVEMELVETA